MNKKGYSTGMTWIFGLVSIFGIGVLYIVFNQVFLAHLVPTMKNIVEESTIETATKTEIYYNYDKFMAYFQMLPFILFFVIVVYMVIASFRKESEGEFF
jgi:type II secretory pathway component PulF